MEIECEYRKNILLFKFVKQKPEIKKKKDEKFDQKVSSTIRDKIWRLNQIFPIQIFHYHIPRYVSITREWRLSIVSVENFFQVVKRGILA